MTSERGECFVYLTLPGQTSAVTAGRFVLSTGRKGDPLGRFVYGKSYLADPRAVAIDPLELKLLGRTYETTRLNGVFGALRDAGPDYWGRRVIERHAGKTGMSELDYLLHSADDRAGALGFGLNPAPPAPRHVFNQTLQLAKLQRIADQLLKSEATPREADAPKVEELLLLGTSMGGARPKAVVEDAAGLWVAKFNRPDDKWNQARVEHAMLSLARACGVTTAESRVVTAGRRDVLLVKRFDRERTEAGYLRSRMVSALTLLRGEESYQARDNWSYVLLAEELRRVSASPEEDARQLFSRMCFNALISNIDDHPRNHALLAKDTDWRLSPAYDLTPSTPVSLERRDLALTVGDEGRYANARNLLSQSARFLMKPSEAKRVVDAMEKKVKANWYKLARKTSVTEKDCETISGAFAYPGFRL
jgi:serine/threonine-protein kinase HipA